MRSIFNIFEHSFACDHRITKSNFMTNIGSDLTNRIFFAEDFQISIFKKVSLVMLPSAFYRSQKTELLLNTALDPSQLESRQKVICHITPRLKIGTPSLKCSSRVRREITLNFRSTNTVERAVLNRRNVTVFE